jgi:uroporphyrinogen-III decarboxylase
MISPRTFRNQFMPYYRRVAENITLPWIFHTDGNFLAVFEDLLSLGMNALHPIEPDAVDILEVKQRAAGRVSLVGNIDINLLSSGTVQEVGRVTRETIGQVAPGGRFILSSSNSITRSCRVDNVRAMVSACRRYGKYPF